MKKVLFVATVVRLHINMFHQPYLRWFHDRGWQVDVAANNDYEEPEQCVIPYCDHHYVLPFQRSPLKVGNWQAYRQLKALLDREHYDIIHCHTPMGSVVARMAAGSARNRGTKVIYTAHGFHFFRGAPWINWLVYYPIERLLSRRTDLLLTMNREDYHRAQSFHAGRVELVNGVGLDLSRFRPADRDQRQALRRELGLKEGETFAISVAQLIPRKNHETMIHTVALLRNPGFHLFILGDGAQEAQLRQLAGELGVAGQIHFLGFRQDVCRLCGGADLFLFSSLQEGLPVAVMEAMACGLPIVASSVRGVTDLLDQGRGGRLVRPGDAEGFARAIESLLSDREEMERMGRVNLSTVARYSLENVTGQMARLYESVM